MLIDLNFPLSIMSEEIRFAERTSGKIVIGAIGASCCVPLAVAGGTFAGALGIAGALLLVSKKIVNRKKANNSSEPSISP